MRECAQVVLSAPWGWIALGWAVLLVVVAFLTWLSAPSNGGAGR